MHRTIEVVFDGTAFVPTEPVDLPAGTKVTVEVPERGTPGVSAGPPPPPMTDAERAEWEDILASARAAESPWATVEEALAYARGRPWPEPAGDDP